MNDVKLQWQVGIPIIYFCNDGLRVKVYRRLCVLNLSTKDIKNNTEMGMNVNSPTPDD